MALIAAAALLGFANYFAYKYHAQWDWTSAGFYSLSSKTRNILDNLDSDVRIVSFLTGYGPGGGDALAEIDAVLERMEVENPGRIKLERIDPARDPLKAQQLLQEFNIDPRRSEDVDVVVIESGTRRKHVRLDEMIQTEPASLAGPGGVKALTAEGALASAIVAVTRAHRPVLRFASGHGERALDERREGGLSKLAESLRRADMDVVSWKALGEDAVPAGTDLLVIAGPTQPWLKPEQDALRAYLDQGGRIWILADPAPLPGQPSRLASTGLETLLGEWDLTLEDDVVLDPSRAPAFMGAETFVAEQTGGHPITEPLAGGAVLLSLARSITLEEGGGEQQPEILLETSPDGWGETTLGSTEAPRRDAADRLGPLSVATAAERPAGQTASGGEQAPGADSENAGEAEAPGQTGGGGDQGKSARLVVVGDADMASNLLIDSAMNRAFCLNTVSWLLEEQQSLGIPPKDRQLTQILLTPEQSLTVFAVAIAGLPLLAILLALGLWWRRRRS